METEALFLSLASCLNNHEALRDFTKAPKQAESIQQHMQQHNLHCFHQQLQEKLPLLQPLVSLPARRLFKLNPHKMYPGVTFGSLHQFDLHHFLRDGFPPADVESNQRPRLLQRLHRSAVSHIPNIHLVNTQDDIVNPETHTQPDISLI